MALCLGAVLGPIAGLVAAPFAFLGAACVLMSLVLACVEVHESSGSKPSVTQCGRRDAA
jgi:hypothetical protein